MSLYKAPQSVSYNFKPHQEGSLFDLVKAGDVDALNAQTITLQDLDAPDATSRTLMQCVSGQNAQAMFNHFFEVAKKALANEPEGRDAKGRCVMHWAAKCNQPESVIAVLIKDGIDINDDKNPYKVTPTYIAASEGKLDVLNALIAHDADVRLTAVNGAGPLHAACEDGNLDAVNALVDAGAEVDKACFQGGTPLLIATQKGHEAIVDCLLSKNCDPSPISQDGATPLFVAAQNGFADIVRRLIDAGVEPTPLQDGTTVLQAAQKNNHEEVIMLLEAVAA